MTTAKNFKIWVLEDNDEDFELLEMAAQKLPYSIISSGLFEARILQCNLIRKFDSNRS